MIKIFIICFIIVYLYVYVCYKEIKQYKQEKELKIIKQNRKYFNIDIQ